MTYLITSIIYWLAYWLICWAVNNSEMFPFFMGMVQDFFVAVIIWIFIMFGIYIW